MVGLQDYLKIAFSIPDGDIILCVRPVDSCYSVYERAVDGAGRSVGVNGSGHRWFFDEGNGAYGRIEEPVMAS